MQPELISVIIPTHNRAHTLSRAIRSVLDQTYNNLEIIVVDDGSTDNTTKVVSEIKDARVKYVKLPENKGAAAARNEGIRQLTGEYISFLDSDDQWMPEKLELSLNVFRNNKESNIGLVYTNGRLIKQGKQAKFFISPKNSGIVYSSKQRAKNIFPTSPASPGTPFWVLSKKALVRTGFFDEKIKNWEDVDFFVRLARNFDIYFLNLSLVMIYEQLQHLGAVNLETIKSKNYFFEKYKNEIVKDKRNFYRFTQKMARDWLFVGDKKFARKYFWKALKIKPYRLELIVKALATLSLVHSGGNEVEKKRINISFLNVNICLKTNNKPYYLFLKEYFAPLICQSQANKKEELFFDICWEHKWWEQRVSEEILSSSVRVGTNTYISDKKTATVFKEKQKIFFSWQEEKGRISGKAIIRHRFGKDRFFYLLIGSRFKEYFYQLTLQAFYYPLFYYFHRKRNMLALHASAIKYKKKGVLFCGLDGVGKTSLALSLVKNEKASLLSDNLVLIGDGKVYSCYEQIRLHTNQTYFLDKDLSFGKSNTDKGFYLLPKEKLTQEGQIKLVFFLESALSNGVFPISLEDAGRRAICLSRLSGELQKYPAFCSFYKLISNSNTISEEEIVHLAFAGAQCFRVQMDFSLGAEYNAEFIRKKIEELS